MKALSRMYVWWPSIDADIEKSIRLCQACQAEQAVSPVVPFTPWMWPTRPWVRLHIDFAGPMDGRMFLVVIDAHSKWIEVFPTSSTTSAVVISCLTRLFSSFGLPETIVSDNGTCFVSAEFQQFLKQHGIRQITSAPYHPASNGLAERAVQIVKKGLRKINQGDIYVRLSRILFSYRTAPQTTTGISPAELLLGRRLRSRLDLLIPSIEREVVGKQIKQKRGHDKNARVRLFHRGDKVYAHNVIGQMKWSQGEVVESIGLNMYRVRLVTGQETLTSYDVVLLVL